MIRNGWELHLITAIEHPKALAWSYFGLLLPAATPGRFTLPRLPRLPRDEAVNNLGSELKYEHIQSINSTTRALLDDWSE